VAGQHLPSSAIALSEKVDENSDPSVVEGDMASSEDSDADEDAGTMVVTPQGVVFGATSAMHQSHARRTFSAANVAAGKARNTKG
jgi:hypothetical protein